MRSVSSEHRAFSSPVLNTLEMAGSSSFAFLFFFFSCLALCSLHSFSHAQLTPNFYSTSCPLALTTIRTLVRANVTSEPRMGASLVRLHFHDCFVNGCDASVLLDDSATIQSEKSAPPNMNSLRGFELVDTIKAALEVLCPRVVSCADILAVAARDSVAMLGGPNYAVMLGRRDSLIANQSGASTDLPPPSFSLTQLNTSFAQKKLSFQDMVALSGAHTFGRARCVNFRDHLNESNIDPAFAATLRPSCSNSSADDNNLANLDVSTPNAFDNAYYRNLLNRRGLLHSDQELFNGGAADAIVRTYSTSPTAFFTDFGNAMIKMGNISPLTGTSGQIRLNCRRVN
ncbi:peroxidase P7-like isoform X3 [Nymphaea colorata]|uniref:peroxidase P7-like isoform X3 n=1 Tax=Nymphaea colorata TaxID=210225 RepID=UPI00129E4424|nr:peroxidase P7-like isoform X3 [Nymphaea colorata]